MSHSPAEYGSMRPYAVAEQEAADFLPAEITAERLPVLVDRAQRRLADARTSAEAIEAHKLGDLAFHHAKLTGAANETQGDCIRIIARAEIMIAREFDAAQARGEVSRGGRPSETVQTSDSLGLDRRRIAEWRDLAEAGEEAVDDAIDEVVREANLTGRNVSKSAVRDRVAGRSAAKPPVEPGPDVPTFNELVGFLCRVPHERMTPEEACEISDPEMIAAIDRYFDQAMPWIEEWSAAWRMVQNAKRPGDGRAA
jgi:hypothetical protein